MGAQSTVFKPSSGDFSHLSEVKPDGTLSEYIRLIFPKLKAQKRLKAQSLKRDL